MSSVQKSKHPQNRLLECIEAHVSSQEVILFYPGGGRDASPILELLPLTSKSAKIVYADYDAKIEDIAELVNNSKASFKKIGNLIPSNLGQKDWKDFWPFKNGKFGASNQFRCADDSFAVYFETTGMNGQEVELQYWRAEAVGTYSAMVEIGMAPNVIILHDHGSGINWTQFGGENELWNIGKQAPPELLLVGRNTSPWPSYEQISEYSSYQASNGVSNRAVFKKVT